MSHIRQSMAVLVLAVLGMVGCAHESHSAHHIAQIIQLQEHDFSREAQTWRVMRQHVDVIADALTTALAKQFPTKLS
jgi:hypothetical protein